jgi:hypothetical protein
MPLRTPSRTKGRNRVSQPTPMLAPVGGINARDADGAMASTDAKLLVNWWPRQRDVVSRKGTTLHCDTGSAVPIDYLLSFDQGASDKMLAFSGGSIYDVSGIAPSTLFSGLGGSEFIADFISSYAVIVNGVDTPMLYNGVTVTTTPFTGVGLTPSSLSFAHAFKGRMFFIEKGTQNIWYAGLGNIAGPLSKFPLNQVGKFTGSLMILTTISVEGGNGPGDRFVAIFDSGDVVVYAGSDPGNAADWDRVGTYKIGRPLSPYVHDSNGSDIRIVTTRGYESLAPALRAGEALRLKEMISDKIQEVASNSINYARNDLQWRTHYYSLQQMFIVQVPQGGGRPTLLHCQNTNTGAWTIFDGVNSSCFCNRKDNVFVGTPDGRVLQFWSGDTDAGLEITLDAQTSWFFLGSSGHQKLLELIKLIFTGYWFPTIYIGVSVDYKPFRRMTVLNVGPQQQPAYWNQDHWNQAYWSQGKRTKTYWHKHGALGTAISMRVTAVGHKGDLSWNSTVFITEQGDLI